MNAKRLLISSLIAGLAATALLIPGTAGAKSYGAGVVPNGIYDICSKPDPDTELDFDFAGRMPVGNKFYQVTAGHGTARWLCGPEIPLLQLTGTTGKGVFQWNCSGGIDHRHDGLPIQTVVELLEDLFLAPPLLKTLMAGPGYVLNVRCSTVGRTDSFRFSALFETLRDLNSDPESATFVIAGAYVTVGP